MKSFLFFLLLCCSISVSAQNVNFIATEACFGNQTVFAGSSAFSDSDISAWLWDMNNDGQYDDATGKMTNYFFSQSGTFNVGLKITLTAGGADSMAVPKAVIVNPVPDVNFHVDNLCEGKEAVYINKSSISSGNIAEKKWDFDNDGNFDDINKDTTTYTCGPAATYISKLECVSDKGCAAFSTKTTQVFHQPVADFAVQNACTGTNTSFINNSTLQDENISFNVWDFGDGTQATSAADVNHQYSSAQSYTVRLVVVSENSCKDTFSANVIVSPLPEISLTVSDSIVYKGAQVTISVTETLSNYTWSNGATTQSITVSDSGTYSVTATDSKGCSETLSQKIILKELPETAEAGNDIITPNNDGINDYFIVADLSGYSSCAITIYNIWNEEVYSSSGYKNDWDGKNKNGKELDAGAYFYILQCDDKSQTIGTVNILR